MSIHAKRLKNGRSGYEVKLRTLDGRQYSRSFRTRKEAEAFQVRERSAQMQGTWVDPGAGRLAFGVYAERWLAQRVGLRPRTAELYDYLLRHHVLPTFTEIELKDISVAHVRAWHAEFNQKPSTGASTVAKAYRLLRTIMATAVEDELVLRNPCLLKGASVERPPNARWRASRPSGRPRQRCRKALPGHGSSGHLGGLRFGSWPG